MKHRGKENWKNFTSNANTAQSNDNKCHRTMKTKQRR